MKEVIWENLCKPNMKIISCVESRLFAAFRYYVPRVYWEDFYMVLSPFVLTEAEADTTLGQIDPWFAQPIGLFDEQGNATILENNLPRFNHFLSMYGLVCRRELTEDKQQEKERFIESYVLQPKGILVSVIDRARQDDTEHICHRYHAFLVKAVNLGEGRMVYLTDRGEESVSITEWIRISVGLFYQLGPKDSMDNKQTEEDVTQDISVGFDLDKFQISVENTADFLHGIIQHLRMKDDISTWLDGTILALAFSVIPYFRMIKKRTNGERKSIIESTISSLEMLRLKGMILKHSFDKDRDADRMLDAAEKLFSLLRNGLDIK